MKKLYKLIKLKIGQDPVNSENIAMYYSLKDASYVGNCYWKYHDNKEFGMEKYSFHIEEYELIINEEDHKEYKYIRSYSKFLEDGSWC